MSTFLNFLASFLAGACFTIWIAFLVYAYKISKYLSRLEKEDSKLFYAMLHASERHSHHHHYHQHRKGKGRHRKQPETLLGVVYPSGKENAN